MRKTLRLTIASIALVCGVAVTSHADGQEETHGTINIALANAHGLVAEADSMLSTNGIPVLPAGQKLYKADDHTVYMIASFFSDTGPEFPSGQFPAYTVIRSLMLRYIRTRNPSLTVSQQLDDLSAYVGMQLSLVEAMHRAIDPKVKMRIAKSSSLITIAAYENGKPVIGHIEVAPSLKDFPPFVTLNKTIDVASKGLISKVYGVTDVAREILDHPDRLQNDRSILSRYRQSLSANGGSNLTTEDLKRLASRLEELTVVRHPFIVGRDQEIAVMQNGKIVDFSALNPSEYELTGNEYDRAQIGRFPHFGMSGSCDNIRKSRAVAVRGIDRYVILLDEGQFRCLSQPLDKLIITNSNFDGCRLFYGGDPVSYFGSNNAVTNSTLVLGPNVRDDSPFVTSFRAAHPEVPIERGEE